MTQTRSTVISTTLPPCRRSDAGPRCEQHLATIAAIDPDQSPLVLLQIQHRRAILERTRTRDHVELFVRKPRLSLRDDLNIQSPF